MWDTGRGSRGLCGGVREDASSTILIRREEMGDIIPGKGGATGYQVQYVRSHLTSVALSVPTLREDRIETANDCM